MKGPAGAQPSGLPASVQETRTNLQTLRLQAHAIDLVPRGDKSTLRAKTSRRHDDQATRHIVLDKRHARARCEALKCQLQLHMCSVS
jgi:hypothetical protein